MLQLQRICNEWPAAERSLPTSGRLGARPSLLAPFRRDLTLHIPSRTRSFLEARDPLTPPPQKPGATSPYPRYEPLTRAASPPDLSRSRLTATTAESYDATIDFTEADLTNADLTDSIMEATSSGGKSKIDCSEATLDHADFSGSMLISNKQYHPLQGKVHAHLWSLRRLALHVCANLGRRSDRAPSARSSFSFSRVRGRGKVYGDCPISRSPLMRAAVVYTRFEKLVPLTRHT